MKRALYFALHVVLPVAIGTAIYIGWRDQNMWVFRWIDAVGANWLVVRPDIPLPDWVKNCLPDGCWVYAYTSWMLMIWRRMNVWVVTGVVLAVGGELGQLVGLVVGTYDYIDMICYLGGFLLSWVIYAKTAPVVGGGGGDHGGSGDGQRAHLDQRPDHRNLVVADGVGPDGHRPDGHRTDGDRPDGHAEDRPVIPPAGDTARP